jgi:hypothetical protein
MKNIGVLISFLLFVHVPEVSWGKKDKTENTTQPAKQVLIVGLNDNVKSNYYYDDLIAKETGLNADSIDHHYNRIIAGNIASSSPGNAYQFITANEQTCLKVTEKIEVKGEGEECTSNLNKVSQDELQQLLSNTHAEYLLVINQHYLKWQEKPMRTLFHIISYTVYNKQKQQVYNGNQFFTSMKLESPERISQISRKTSSKIASSVAKAL